MQPPFASLAGDLFDLGVSPLSLVRERGFEDFDEVALVVLETNGHISVMGRAAADRWRAGR
jgi:hypothetical protein